MIQSAHVSKGGSGLVESPFLELRLAEQHPGAPEKRVVLPASQPFAVLGSLALAAVPFGLGLDTVATDRFLALLDGTVILAFADFAALLVTHHVEGDYLGIVVLIALLFFQIAVDESLITIKIGIIARIERVPPASAGCILLGRTA